MHETNKHANNIGDEELHGYNYTTKTANERTPNVASLDAVRRELQYCRPVAK